MSGRRLGGDVDALGALDVKAPARLSVEIELFAVGVSTFWSIKKNEQ